MVFIAFFLFGTLLLCLLLGSMGMTFEDVFLTLVALLLLGLFGLITMMQVIENRQKKKFGIDSAPPLRRRRRRSRWYRQRRYQWATGLLILGVLVTLGMHLKNKTTLAETPATPATEPAATSPAPAPISLPAPEPTPAAVAASSAAATPAQPPVATEPATTPALPAPPAAPTPVTSAAAEQAKVTVITAPLSVAGSTPPPPQAADARVAVESAIQAWAKAWSAGDAEAYLGMYGTSFKPPRSETRAQWERTRRERVTAAQQITVGLDDLAIHLSGPTQAEARFVQRYAAHKLQDKSRKLLKLALENGHWKIISETVLVADMPVDAATR